MHDEPESPYEGAVFQIYDEPNRQMRGGGVFKIYSES